MRRSHRIRDAVKNTIKKRLAAFRSACHGNVVVEYALCAPILLLMMALLFDFGMAVYDSMSLKEAARAGAEYAVSHASDTAGLVQVVSNASGVSPQSLSITSNQFCECADGSSVSCGTKCADGSATETYFKVSVQEPYTTLLPYPQSIAPLTLSGSAALRIR